MCLKKITLVNVEEMIFSNPEIIRKLENKSIKKWIIGLRTNLISVQKDAIIEFFNTVTDEDKKIISEVIGDFEIEKLDLLTCKSYKYLVGDFKIPADVYQNIVLYRDKDKVYLTTWR